MRLAGGAEALVARVVTTPGVAGYGFSFGTEATPARDMAAWDALARSRNVPLYALFDGKKRLEVPIGREEPGSTELIDPFEALSIEAARVDALARERFCLVAPHGHPWELAYCAALAASLPGEARIASSGEPAARSIRVSDAPGIAIDWSIEPGFATIAWYDLGMGLR